jgi:hypothetical protein
MSPWRVRGESAEGKIRAKFGSVLADIEVGNAEAEVCDCTKHNLISINQLKLQPKKNEMVSINQLNYKAPEEYHDTEDLVGYNLIL